MASDPHANGSTSGGFTQAAEAAALLLDQLERYESALDQIDGLRSDIGTLRKQVSEIVGPTKNLASAAEKAALAYQAVEAIRPDVQRSLSTLREAANTAASQIEQQTEAAGTTISERVGIAADTAAGRIEASAVVAAQHVHTATTEGSAEVARSLTNLDEALRQVTVAAELIEQKVKADGLAGAGKLVDALLAATEQIRKDSKQTLAILVEPASQAGDALIRARAETNTMVAELREGISGAKADLHRSMTETDAVLKRQLAEADEELRRTRSHDLRLLVRLAAATLGAVLLFGVAGLVRGCGSGSDVPLDEAVVQVLNGVDPRVEIAGVVVNRLEDEVESDHIAEVVGSDAATTRQGQTLILLHGASVEAGRELAAILGLGPERIVAGNPLPLTGHLTVLVGADYRESLSSVFAAVP